MEKRKRKQELPANEHRKLASCYSKNSTPRALQLSVLRPLTLTVPLVECIPERFASLCVNEVNKHLSANVSCHHKGNIVDHNGLATSMIQGVVEKLDEVGIEVSIHH